MYRFGFFRPAASVRMVSSTMQAFPRLHNNNNTNFKSVATPQLLRRTFSGQPAPLSQQEVTDRVINLVKHFHRIPPTAEVKADTHFTNDLGLDSLDQVEMVMALEDEFFVEIPDGEADKMQTCSDAIKYILTVPWAR